MEKIKQQDEATEFRGIDETLASEEALVPSSGFLASVMERVENEATTPAPIPFPWKRAIPGFALALVVFVGAAVKFALLIASPAKEALTKISIPPPTPQTEWIALALALTLASLLFVRKLVGRSESL